MYSTKGEKEIITGLRIRSTAFFPGRDQDQTQSRKQIMTECGVRFSPLSFYSTSSKINGCHS